MLLFGQPTKLLELLFVGVIFYCKVENFKLDGFQQSCSMGDFLSNQALLYHLVSQDRRYSHVVKIYA